ncbi:MAG: NADH-quinone oxidoreductase subunit J [Planctomycetes bacterium]|nr:NADH-quinone oxidoreductase subunit J [Planctomycetota bacterium]
MAFWLLFSFAGFAGLYFLLGADFLALTQVMVYIGGILILILFGVMLTRRRDGGDSGIARDGAPRGSGLVVQGVTAAGLLGLLAAAVHTRTPWAVREAGEPAYTAAGLGDLLLTDFILPFEVASVVLLVALVGAAYIVRREPEEGE